MARPATSPSTFSPAAAPAGGRGAPVRHPSASILLQPNWANVTTAGVSAPPSGGGVLVNDAHDGYVLWYGLRGVTSGGGETWTYASGLWINRTPTAGTGPAGATWGTAAYDAADGYVVWYGGAGTPASVGTWKYVGGSWANLTGSLGASPTPARYDTSIAYDPAESAVVLFGGWDGSAYLSDTWTYAHGTWTSVASTAVPAARADAGLAYDASDGDLLLAGGGTASGPLSDTWGFASGNWTELLAAGAPTGIGGAQGLSPAPGGGVVAFGGSGCVISGEGPCNFTYEFYLGSWQTLSGSDGPSPRVGLELVYDSEDGLILAWGGNSGGTWRNDTWALGGPIHLRVVVTPDLVASDDDTDFLAFAGGGYGGFDYAWSGVPPDCPLVNSSDMPCESEIPGNYTVVSHLSDAAGNATTGLAALRILFELSSELFITPAVIDVGQPVLLRVLVSGGGPVAGFFWNGLPLGCGAAIWSEVNCTPTNPGYYTIVVNVTDTLGHVTLSPALGLTVNALPTVGIWSNASLGAAPFAVQFDSTVFGGTAPYRYSWNFGDGGESSLSDPTHTFAGAGVFPVTLTVNDSGSGRVSTSSNFTIDVANPLSLSGSVSSTYPSVGQAVTFEASITGGFAPYRYAWTFGDGATSTAASPSHAFTSAGDHAVVLIVTDGSGGRSDTTVIVDVQPGAGSGASVASLLASPWVAGVIGAVLGIIATTIALQPGVRPPASPPRAKRAPPPEGSDSSPPGTVTTAPPVSGGPTAPN